LGVPVNFVKYWWKRYKAVGHCNDMPRSGRPKVIPADTTQKVVVKVLELQSVTTATQDLIDSGDLPQGTARSTVYTTLMQRCGKLLKWGPQKYTPNITAANVVQRMSFARQHLNAGTNWAGVMAIDSCMFRLDRVGGRKGVWRLLEDGPQRAAGVPSHSRKGALHAYAGITAFGKTHLVFVSGTTGMRPSFKNGKGEWMKGVGAAEFQHVLQTKLVPSAEEIFSLAEVDSWQLLMDRAPAHAAASTQRWLQRHDVSVVSGWPGNSPDLNPIENLWGWMKAKLYRKDLRSVTHLRVALLQLWEQVPDYMLTHLMASVDRRLRNVIGRQGRYTGR
jgi:DDE superfamily endonuclease